jgi:hypothetical protein
MIATPYFQVPGSGTGAEEKSSRSPLNYYPHGYILVVETTNDQQYH